MTPNPPTKLGMAINGLFMICIACFVIAIAHNHFNLISHGFPLDYNEGGMLVTTSAIAQWVNPYSLESQPSLISLYPVFYNILVAPLTHVFGNTFELHRAVSGLFILGCCALCYFLCRRDSAGRTESFLAAAILYAGLLYYSTPVASPNALGLFLFLSAITVPWVNGFSTRSLAVSIALGVLAFYTKQYFVACLGYVALYMFLGESKKRAIYFGFASLAVFIPVLVLVQYTSPYYLEDTFFAVQSSAKFAASEEKVVEQLKELSQIYFPLLVILIVGIAHRWRSISLRKGLLEKNSQKIGYVNLFDFGQPLFLRKPNYIWVCCACSLIIFVLVLGKNRGNHMTYLFQLVSPFLLVAIFSLMSGMPRWRWPFSILIVFAFYNNYAMLPADFHVKEKNWQKIRKEISKADDVYASTLVIKEVIDKGDPIYISGGTRYFSFGNDKPAFFDKTNPENAVPEVWERYVENLHRKIRNQEFDLLLIDNWMPLPNLKKGSGVDTETLLKEHYRKAANMKLPLMKRLGGGGFRLQIWRPIPATLGKN
ncbi:MAG: hypothetical protein ACI9JM_002794 [Halioglobus sp.]|jgi:hypothetical protein